MPELYKDIHEIIYYTIDMPALYAHLDGDIVRRDGWREEINAKQLADGTLVIHDTKFNEYVILAPHSNVCITDNETYNQLILQSYDDNSMLLKQVTNAYAYVTLTGDERNFATEIKRVPLKQDAWNDND